MSETAHHAPGGQAPRRLVILGATGSIGRSTLDILRRAPKGAFEVEAVVGGRDAEALARVALELGAKVAAIAEPGAYGALRAALGSAPIEACAGPDAIIDVARRPADLVVAAIAGAAGLAPTLAAVEAGRAVALANKECLVCAGAPFMAAVERSGALLLPMDSEHNAIFQALGGRDASAISRMILTASGGPFRTWTREQIAAATPEQALAHPNYAMGAKITVDSAGLMNKGLELIEAHFLFAVEAARLDVVIHPQQIVHGMVSFADGSVVAGLSNPDMRTPIAHCLGWPRRLPVGAPALDLGRLGGLHFEPPDMARFPALRVARDALREGGALPTVLNAANEVAVEAFLARRICFADIATTVEKACEEAIRRGEGSTPASLEDALRVDHICRERVRTILA